MGQFKRHSIEELEKMLKHEPEKLIKHVMKLEEYVTRDSTNSSKSPSSDSSDARDKRDKDKGKNTSLRNKSERSPGGQKDHPPAHLQPLCDPQIKHTLELAQCPDCGQALTQKEQTGEIISRQVLDLPPKIELIGTQYDAPRYQCSCGCKTHAQFPDGVDAPVQYGPRLYSWLFHMREQMLLPYKRITVFFKDVIGIDISPATIQRAQHTAYEQLEGFEQKLIARLIEQHAVGADETGFRVLKKRHWLHVASTPQLTYYAVHPKRGYEAMKTFGVLEYFEGRLIHDFLHSYYQFDACEHGLCNQHHLRDLNAVDELGNQSWALQMAELLREMLHRRHEHEQEGTTPSPQEIGAYHKKYNNILNTAKEENPLKPPPKKTKRGRVAKGKARNLYERFRDRWDEIAGFFKDFRVPFTNNGPEQDIRMMKVQQKVSGCFRTEKGAKVFARNRSYLSTMRKQKRNIFQAILAIFEGKPFMPE